MSTNIAIYGILHPLKIFFMPEIICDGIRSPKTAIIVYVTYFPCRGEGHSILTAVTTFYLVFVWNIFSKLLLTDTFLILFRL